MCADIHGQKVADFYFRSIFLMYADIKSLKVFNRGWKMCVPLCDILQGIVRFGSV